MTRAASTEHGSTSTTAGCGCCGGRVAKLTPRDLFPVLSPIIDYLNTVRERACLTTLSELLHNTRVTRDDLGGACAFGANGYKRNCLSRGEWYELLACCWRSGHRTPIHDHRGVSCAFKVIEGEGTEIRFKETPSGLICPTQAVPMPVGYVCAAEDADIHQVANMQSPGADLITLHIYSPPIQKMHTYQWGECSCPESADCYDSPC